jgi:hypothetical protein
MPNGKIVCIAFDELPIISISFACRNEHEVEFLSFGCDGGDSGKVGFRVAIRVLMN